MDIKLDSAQLPALSPGQQLYVGRMLCCGPAVLPCTSPHFSSAHSLPEARYARSPMEGTAAMRNLDYWHLRAILSFTLECHHNWKTTPAKLFVTRFLHLFVRGLESDDTCGPGPGEFVHLGEKAMVAAQPEPSRISLNIGSTVLRELVRQQSHVFTCCASEIPLGITWSRTGSGLFTLGPLGMGDRTGPAANRSPVIILAGSIVAPIMPRTRLFLGDSTEQRLHSADKARR